MVVFSVFSVCGTAFYDNANLSESEEDVDIFFLTTCSAFLSRPLTKCARYRNAMIQGRRSCQPKGGSGMQAIVVITPKGV